MTSTILLSTLQRVYMSFTLSKNLDAGSLSALPLCYLRTANPTAHICIIYGTLASLLLGTDLLNYVPSHRSFGIQVVVSTSVASEVHKTMTTTTS